MVNLDKFKITGKVALVTGAAGLLGKEHCIALAEAGARVLVTDLEGSRLETALSELKERFPSGSFEKLILDVTSEDSIKKALEQVLSMFSRLDILVNNAAIDPKVTKVSSNLEESRFENFDLDNWEFQVNVGLTGAMLCAKHFGSHMAKQGGGVILNIASDLSVIAPDQRIYRKANLPEEMQPVKPVTYSVIKSGLIGLTKYLSTYWAEKNVRVNALSPGGVFNDHPEEFVDKLRHLIPMKRMAHRDEYRSTIQFLCSEASSYMTGQNIILDGGRSVW